MRECPACGADNSEQAKFCRSCGAALTGTADGSTAAATCGNCGEDLRPGATFCRACGAKVEPVPGEARGGGFNARLAAIVGGAVLVVAVVVGGAVLLRGGGSDPDPDGLSSKQRAAFELLQTDAEGPVFARFENGLPRTLRSRIPIPDSVGDDPEAQARYFLSRYADLYLIGDVDSGVEIERVESGEGKAVTVFRRRVGGLPVFGSDLRVHVSEDRMVTYASAAVPVDVRPSEAAPTIADVEAIQAAIDSRGALAEGTSVLDAELVVFNEGLFSSELTESVLAWRVELEIGSPAQLPTVLISASDGTVVFEYDNLNTERNRRTYTANGATTRRQIDQLFFQLWFNETGALEGAAPAQDLEGEDAHFWVGRVYDYYSSTFGRDSYDNSGGTIDSYVHFDLRHPDTGQSISNAFWDHDGGLWYTNGLVTLDIVAHEFTHGVVQHTAGFVYANASGALNESFADVFASFIDGNWTVGEGSTLGVIRVMSDPSAKGHPDHMDRYYTGSDDHGGVHFNSGIPNHAAYLITAGGTHATSGISVDAIGVGKAQRIYYKALTEFLGPSATFMDARDGLLAACLELLETTGDIDYRDCSAVINGYAAVGLGDQDLDHDAVPDNQDNCGRPGTDRIFNPDQADADGDNVGDRCDGSEAEVTAFVATETAAAGETATAALIPTPTPTPTATPTETPTVTPTSTPDTSWVGEVCEGVITTLVAGGVDRDLAEVLAAPACDCLRAQAEAGASREEGVGRCADAVGATPTPSSTPTPSPTVAGSVTPVGTGTATPTSTPTATATTEATATPTSTATPGPTATVAGPTNFAGSWHSAETCDNPAAPYRWQVFLTQNGTSVSGSISFHKCPGEGRVTYAVSGTATAGSSITLNGTKTEAFGGLGGSAPASQAFSWTPPGPPSPNFAP